MSLNVSNSGGGEFELVPAGLYIARCYRILDMGTQTITGMYGTQQKKQIMLSWELLDDEVKMKDGRPFAVHKTYTASLNEKAKLRADLESWRNKKFTDEELSSFDLKNVLGAYCQIQVVHSDDGKYANVQSIVTYKAPKDASGKPIYPKPVNPTVAFDIDAPDMDVFNAFSDNMKQKIMAAPEWQTRDQEAADSEISDPFTGDEMPDDFLLSEADEADKGKR